MKKKVVLKKINLLRVNYENLSRLADRWFRWGCKIFKRTLNFWRNQPTVHGRQFCKRAPKLNVNFTKDLLNFNEGATPTI